ncbi:hypothetical protein FNT36_06565 [Hymenobacter setariae]|uniref:Uncharacterized protein n=1 Tax=Hymenobacter setariae TaxID=2594794 RepID=A0A558C4P4_9BACT|nr:hypothetical protein [Hymenobacter setariae]TVT43744.1 hypothetical protein FNT36_06565 [Hymenobacter setariae]
MEYSCYKEAFDAVVKDNDGVLPDLYEVFDFIIYSRPSNLSEPLTVAEIVAYALIEAREARVIHSIVEPNKNQLPMVPALVGEPQYLTKLFDQAAVSLN